jgi:predicted PhzF superfamily epimerase YddE/YHI9
MALEIVVVDAFTNHPFAGNPAAVCQLASPLSEPQMQTIAAEMNLSETAFAHPIENGYALRWFTPTSEIALCGHATLATAHALWEGGILPADEPARFSTMSGWLTCRQAGSWIEMDFPANVPVPSPTPIGMAEALGSPFTSCAKGGQKWLVEFETAVAVRGLRPDFRAIKELDCLGVIVTALADEDGFDFVSRYFAPALGVNEDPVTGSAHCVLAPYWASKLGRTDMVGYQVSARGGVVRVGLRGDRVLLSGQAVTVSRVDLLRLP